MGRLVSSRGGGFLPLPVFSFSRVIVIVQASREGTVSGYFPGVEEADGVR